jgi:hypothetical protein
MPVQLFASYEDAIAGLRAYEQQSVFRPIVLYEYVFQNGSATYPSWFYRIEREGSQTNLAKYPVNPTEFRKVHPFLFAQPMTEASLEPYRAC